MELWADILRYGGEDVTELWADVRGYGEGRGILRACVGTFGVSARGGEITRLWMDIRGFGEGRNATGLRTDVRGYLDGNTTVLRMDVGSYG